MYGKLFRSMYDGSLHGQWEAIATLQQLVILANRHGEVDMTARAIAATTSFPLDVIERGLAQLSEPDPESRNPDDDGRRIVPLDPGRGWGWRITNYLVYRNTRDADDRREQNRTAQAKRRGKRGTGSQPTSA